MSDQISPVQIGSAAPLFELRSQHGEPTALADFRGHKSVVVVFYPFAFSGICSSELCEIRDDLARFQNDAVQVLAISCDTMQVQRAFAEAQGLDFPLLTDFWPHGAVASAYGIFSQTVGVALRASFLVDTEGIVRWSVVNEIGQARDFAGYREALASG